ncbi:MAG TPA: hypothetical protein VG265_13385 [Gaiellaceae bacterium]|nr:hypothetical protein [Gaiellaceae bacterium]
MSGAIRAAVVANASTAKQLWAYLPGNYAIVAGLDGDYVIAGVDSHGWTLDDYVIPRLASGLIWAREIDGDELVATMRRLGPFGDLQVAA